MARVCSLYHGVGLFSLLFLKRKLYHGVGLYSLIFLKRKLYHGVGLFSLIFLKRKGATVSKVLEKRESIVSVTSSSCSELLDMLRN